MWEIVQKTKKDFIKIFSNNPTVVFYVTNLLFIFVILLFIFCPSLVYFCQSLVDFCQSLVYFCQSLVFFCQFGLKYSIEEFKANFLMNPYGAYKFLYNSSMNKRGTGI